MLLDLKAALRSLKKSPTFTLTALATLAMGIGATVAMLSVVEGVLLQSLPYPDSSRLTVFWAEWPDREVFRLSHNGNDFREYQRRAQLFEGIGALGSLRQNLTGSFEPVQVQVGWISENFFRVMRVSPFLGRDFTDDEPASSVLLGYGVWQRQFGADPDVVGKRIELDRKPYDVVGVLPPFRLWLAADVGIATDIDLWKAPDPIGSPGRWKAPELDQSTLRIVARMKPGVTLEQAQADMDSVSESLRKDYPDHARAGFHIEVASLQAEVVGHVRSSLLALLGAVGLVLLIACANVASLQIVRAQARRDEIAIRAALGGTPRQIGRQLFLESLLLAVGGGALGLALGSSGARILLAIDSGKLPRAETVAVDGTVLALTLGITLGTALLFGLVPALRSVSADLRQAVSTRLTETRSSRRWTEALVTLEIALSLVLVVGAGLLLRSFAGLTDIRPGFDARNLLTFSISLPSADYPPPVVTAQFVQRLEENIQSLPGVVSVGTVWPLPLEGQKWFGYYRTTEVANEEDTLPVADFRLSSPGYLETMGARLLEGRYAREEDRNKVVVDETLARRNWPDGTAVGQMLWIQLDGGSIPAQVVGVVENIRHADLTRDGRETIYLAARAFTWADFELALVVRTAGDPSMEASAIRKTLAEMDPKIPMAKVRPATDYLADAVAPNRIAFVLAAFFGAMALLLAGIGLYGVMAYDLTRRARELSVRIALGASRSRVAGAVLRVSLRLVATGTAFGLLGLYLLRGLLAGLLYGVGPGDPWTYAGTAALLGLMALLGSLGPLARAIRVDPATTLRQE